MEGFEFDKWETQSIRGGDWKIFIHKKFPFIKINFIKESKGYNKSGPTWRVSLDMWKYLPPYKNRYYGRLTKNIIEKEFEKLMKNENAKTIIMQYLFEGRW